MYRLIHYMAISLIATYSLFAAAAERVDVCIKYKERIGWSKGYVVNGIVINGMELNSAIGYTNRFDVTSTYVVVFWNKEKQASIFGSSDISVGR